jgi:signal transduction histidine kinase
MLGRLGFSGRLVAIVLLAFLAIQAIAAGIGYVARKRATAGEALMLLPERTAAIVDILESTPRDQHKALLKALSSESLSVAVSEVRPAFDPDAQRLPAVEWVVSQHLSEVGRKEVVASITPEPGRRWLRIGRYWPASRVPLHIAIALEGGGYAVFETRGDIAPRVFGLPPGFFIGALGALVGIAALLAIWREARPLRALAASVTRFSGDSVPDPVPARGAPEIRRLITAVNDMQARIATLVKSRTVLLGAISHDLKTYITRLRLRAESVEDSDQRNRTVRDLDDMAALLDDALAVARGTSVSERRESVDLGKLVASQIGERSAGRIAFHIGARTGDSTVLGDPVALRRLVANIVDNALRYASSADIAIASIDGTVELLVDDDGPGIPEAERSLVFEPFYRLEASRNRATGGSGLGLAIARQIVEAHGGTIAIETAPSGGTRVLIRFPAAE